jgi:ComF family protein
LFQGERVFCLSCTYDLPKSYFHEFADNPVQQVFWGRVPLEHAMAFLLFTKKGKAQHLIHQLKYKGKQEVGRQIGRLYAQDLKNAAHPVCEVDQIIPVPLDPIKQQKRGYNQSSCFAEGLAEVLQVPVEEKSLVRQHMQSSQTRLGRMQRWDNVSGRFQLRQPQSLENRHVLLVDDVLTTGATLEACAIEILKAKGSRLSIATMAYAW